MVCPGVEQAITSDKLSDKLSWSYINAGEIFRELAKAANMDLNEFGALQKLTQQ